MSDSEKSAIMEIAQDNRRVIYKNLLKWRKSVAQKKRSMMQVLMRKNVSEEITDKNLPTLSEEIYHPLEILHLAEKY